MSKNLPTPDLLTTLEYVNEATELLGEVHTHREVHTLKTKVLEPNERVPAPHVFEAELIVPLADQSEDRARVCGPQRLTLSFWTPRLSRRDEIVDGSRVRVFNNGDEQPCLAEARFTFNTRRLLDYSGVVFADGIANGLDESPIQDASKSNLGLRELASLLEMRPLSVARAAHYVTQVSLSTGGSEIQKDIWVDFNGLTREIQSDTKKPVPPSLQDPPRVDVNIRHLLGPTQKDPAKVIHETTVDTWSPENGRTISNLVTTWYQGYTPLAFDRHFAFYGLRTRNGEETGLSFAVDATQQVSGPEGDAETSASTPMEVREMVAPYIQAVTNLRRYATVAYS